MRNRTADESSRHQSAVADEAGVGPGADIAVEEGVGVVDGQEGQRPRGDRREAGQLVRRARLPVAFQILGRRRVDLSGCRARGAVRVPRGRGF